MGRSIPELMTALYAGESISTAEGEQILRHVRRVKRINEILSRAAPVPLGAGFAGYRREILRNLHRFTEPEKRALIRQLLLMLRLFIERDATQQGRHRLVHRQRQRGVDLAARKNQTARDELHREIDALHAKYPSSTPRAIARRYLRFHVSDWDSLSRTEKARRTDSLLRRLRRKKNPGQS